MLQEGDQTCIEPRCRAKDTGPSKGVLLIWSYLLSSMVHRKARIGIAIRQKSTLPHVFAQGAIYPSMERNQEEPKARNVKLQKV